MDRETGKEYYAVVKIIDHKGKCFADKGNMLALIQISGILALVTNGTDKFSIPKHFLSPCPVQIQAEVPI